MVTLNIKSELVHGFWRGYRPAKGGPFPTVLLLHGSEGSLSGWSYKQALFLAAHGYFAVPLPYSSGSTSWDAGAIRNVELSDTINALMTIRKSPVSTSKICLYGVSRGAEHALLLASLMAEDAMSGQADCIIVHAPANVTYCAFDSRCVRDENDPGWKAWDYEDNAWLWNGDSKRTKPGTKIKIEHYKNPLFITHGKNDKVWHYSMTEMLENRLLQARRQPEVHYFENEGHSLSAKAENQFNKLMLDFLERTVH